MTVPTIDAVVSHMMRVTELQRLLDELLRAGDIGAAANDYQKADQAAGQKKPSDNTDLREGIGARLKNLRHRMLTIGAPAWRAIASRTRQKR